MFKWRRSIYLSAACDRGNCFTFLSAQFLFRSSVMHIGRKTTTHASIKAFHWQSTSLHLLVSRSKRVARTTLVLLKYMMLYDMKKPSSPAVTIRLFINHSLQQICNQCFFCRQLSLHFLRSDLQFSCMMHIVVSEFDACYT